MPGRKGNKTSWRAWADRTREKIQVTALVNQLTKFVQGLAESVTCPECGHEFESQVKMTQPQVKAAQVLLDKSLPTLTSADMNVREEPRDASEIWNGLVALIGEERAKMILQNPNEPTEQDIDEALEESKDQILQ